MKPLRPEIDLPRLDAGPAPIYKNEAITVTLILRNKVTEHKETIFSETLERIENHWGEMHESQRQIIQLLFEQQEMKLAQFQEKMKLTPQAIRANLRSLTEMEIIERLSEKMRNPDAIYRFLNK